MTDEDLDLMARAQEHVHDNNYRDAVRSLAHVEYGNLDDRERDHYETVFAQLSEGLVEETRNIEGEEADFHRYANQFSLLSEAKQVADTVPRELQETIREIGEKAYRSAIENAEDALQSGDEYFDFTESWRKLEAAEGYAQAAGLDTSQLSDVKREVAEEGIEPVLNNVYRRLEFLSRIDSEKLEELQEGPSVPGQMEKVPRDLVHGSLLNVKMAEDYLEELGKDDFEQMEAFDNQKVRSLLRNANENLVNLVDRYPGHLTETLPNLNEISEKFGFHTELNEILQERAADVAPVRYKMNNAEAQIEKAIKRTREDRGVEEVEDTPEEFNMARIKAGPNALLESARENLDDTEELLEDLDVVTRELEEEYERLREEVDQVFRDPDSL